MVISNEDRELIRKFEAIKKKGLYVQSAQMQKVYNRVFETNMAATSCGTCIRGRISKLVDALNKLENEEREAAKIAEEENKVAESEDVTNNKVPETQDVTENKEAEQQPPEITEEPNDADKRKSQPTKGRKKKSK